MNVLVVGGKSDLSKYLLPLLRRNHHVMTAGRRDCDINLDLTKPLMFPDSIDVVINTAAYFGTNSDEDYLNSCRVNVEGVLNLCIAAKRKGVKHFVHISSLSAVLTPESPYYTTYAITKRLADELLESYCSKQALPLTILRPSQLYGKNTKQGHQPFFYLMVDKAFWGEKISIYGTHDAKRNYLNYADFAEIIRRVVETKTLGTYSCQYPKNVSYREIASTAFKVFNQPEKIEFLADKPDIPDNLFDYDDELYRKIGYYPKTDLATGIAAYGEVLK